MSRNTHIFLFVVILACAVFVSFKIIDNYLTQREYNISLEYQKDLLNKFEEVKIEEIQEAYDNKEVIGLLKVGDINTLVVQGNDNSYYLNHLINGKKNKLGTPFIDYRVSIDSKKIIIYGHNTNRYKPVFNSLEKYLSYDYYKKNNIITLQTEFGLNKYEIFSVSIYKDNYIYFDLNIKDYEKHFNELKSKSLYDINIELSASDDIIVLQTCSSNSNGGFIVICGKKV